MEVLTLIQEARDAGLVVVVDRDELVVRGPRRLAVLAHRLIDRKCEVIAALRIDVPFVDLVSVDVPCVTQAAVEPIPKRPGKRRSRIGNGFGAIKPTIPPASILETPRTMCPLCGARPVLAEL